MLYQSRVVVDDHACNLHEVKVLGFACDMMVALSLGRFEVLGNYLTALLSKELALETQKREDIRWLLSHASSVLWEGRSHWNVYERNRASLDAVIAYSLHRRFRRDKREVAQALKEINDRARFLQRDITPLFLEE